MQQQKPVEQMSDDELNALLAQKKSPQTMQKSVDEMNDTELDNLLLGETRPIPTQPNSAPIMNPEREADLGPSLRSRLVIEPLESNRRALLQKELGAENVFEPKPGQIWVREGNEIVPVNKEGVTVADVAEFAGSLPEYTGKFIGGAVGLSASGVGAIPAAVAGGAAGSLFRQGVSAALGTPQIATIGERFVETGLSAAFSGAGEFVSNKATQAAKNIYNYFKPATKQIGQTAKTIQTQGLGKPTLGQYLGPESTVGKMEKDLSEIPFFGRKIRSQFKEQSDNVVKELKKDIGDFSSDKFSPEAVGSNVKNLANAKVQMLHDTSQSLFKEVSDAGKDVIFPTKELTQSLKENAVKMRLLSRNGSPVKFNARSGMDQKTFNTMQRHYINVLSAIGETGKTEAKGAVNVPKGFINSNELDLIRRSVTGELSDESIKGTNAERYLKTFEKDLLKMTEDGISSVDKTLGNKFKMAREGWSEYRTYKDEIERIGLDKGRKFGGIADEKISSDIAKDTKSIMDYEKFIGKDAVKEAVTHNLAAKVRKSADGDYIRASSVITALKANESVYKEVFGPDKYKKVLDLLSLDKDLKLLANPSGTATKEFRLGALKTGVYYRTILGLLNTGINVPTKLIKEAPRFAPQAQEKKREAAYYMRGPKPTKRQRAFNEKTGD